MRPGRMTHAFAVLVCLALTVPAGASEGGSALNGVALDRSSAVAGEAVSVSGTLTTSEQAGGRIWTDPGFPDEAPNSRPIEPMVDLLEGRVEHALPSDPLTLRIKVAPAVGTDVQKPYLYVWQFHVGQIWYFVQLKQGVSGTSFAWTGNWYYCKLALGSNCIHGTTPGFPVSFDQASRTVTGRVPISDLAAVQPNGVLAQDQFKPVPGYAPEAGYWNAGGTFGPVTLGQQSVVMDRDGPFGTAVYEPFELPIAGVSLGIAPEGTPSGSVTYSRSASISTTAGSLEVPFTGQISTAGLAPGQYSVYVKGCFGPCAVQELPLTVTA